MEAFQNLKEYIECIESKDKKVIFLDEIAELPLELQAKLLRVVQERVVQPLGARSPVNIDVRIITASHQNLNERVKQGRFREDLFYRLNVVSLTLPALSERREDIPLLLAHFLKRLSERYEKGVKAFSPEALEMLIAAPWPGNIRQLYNVAEQVVALSSGEIVSTKVVEQAMQLEMQRIDSFEDARRRFEYDYLTRLLKLTQGSVTQAAKLAKRNRTEFYKLLQRHSIEAAHFKPPTV